MEEEQIYEEIIEEGSLPENAQQSQQANPTGTKQPVANAGQQPSQAQQSQQPQQTQAAGIETNDNMVEEAVKNGQPSNTISEWQRVHDKKYVEDITEKTEKH